VLAQGGEITVTSEEGRGSLFTVSLPAATPVPAPMGALVGRA
jgi:signal transduction histidine kinase